MYFSCILGLIQQSYEKWSGGWVGTNAAEHILKPHGDIEMPLPPRHGHYPSASDFQMN